ncbi:Rpn family recombination-promoting nuclease/putative transposase [Faecalicatena contorta]|uniref:Rpn family recombination-promoting nuclease/putative transposase n=2 Tax=Lachnospirales TaxID=3085636 RepID=UPI001FBB46C6|nr:Rpn family recombination-promoting nuclease/putative transposase [Faecalicatena contorta]
MVTLFYSYAMPVREMLYDALSYADQINELRKNHKEKKDMKVSAEFLSGLKRTDFLSPVLNIVFYYGEEEWDGSTDLHGLLGLDRKEYKLLTKYIPNYRINLIDPKKLENLECFQTDLQMIFGMLKCRKNKEELKRYVQNNRAYFVQVDQDSYNAVCAMLGSTQHLKTVKTEEGGNVNMCKALEDLYQDGVEEGLEKGIEKGIKVLVQDYIEEGYSKEIILDKLIRGFSLNREESSRYYERFAKPAR